MRSSQLTVLMKNNSSKQCCPALLILKDGVAMFVGMLKEDVIANWIVLCQSSVLNVDAIFFCTGVYFEKLLKHSESSIWIKNFQMYLWSTPVTLLVVAVHDLPQILEKGFFFDYNFLVLLIICTDITKTFYGFAFFI